MAQVLGNLVSNALRYTPTGGQIILSACAGETEVSLQVHDTGSGIAAEDLPYIFNRFYRADETRQQRHGESGLGLAIAKPLVEVHGVPSPSRVSPTTGQSLLSCLARLNRFSRNRSLVYYVILINDQ